MVIMADISTTGHRQKVLFHEANGPSPIFDPNRGAALYERYGLQRSTTVVSNIQPHTFSSSLEHLAILITCVHPYSP